MARVRETALGSTPDELLSEPLPEEPGEESDAPPAGELSMAEIARAALAGSAAATREVARDGLLAAELGRKNPPRDVPPTPRAVLDAAGLQGRVMRVPEPAARPPAPAPVAPKTAPHVAVPAEVAAAPASEAAARSEFPAPSSREPRRFGAASFGGAVLALAAATALYVSFAHHDGPEAHLMASAEAPARMAAREQTPTAPQPKAEAPADPEATSVASAAAFPSKQLALNDLEPASKSRASSGNASKEKSLSFHVKKESASNEGKLVLEEQSDTTPSQNTAPPVAKQAASPAPQPLMERPSTGAVSAALGPVLMSARSCVAGQDSGPRATVTFDGPTGRVKSVTLDSSAAGSPAESCIRSALMGARLPPFADPTFTASVTVRPL